jgi:predicted nucleotidyltransferase
MSLKSSKENMYKGNYMSIKTLAEITDILKEHETELKKRYGINEVGIFGSYLRGEAREKSDLDILVEFEQGVDIGLLEFVGIENYLSDLLGVKVDLVEQSALRPRIGKQILKEVIYRGKENLGTIFKISSMP